MPAMVSRSKAIQLSGYKVKEKGLLIEQISKLGATFHPESQFNPDCNILVSKKPTRSEKFLCALAQGIPIVTTRYITDSVAAQKWCEPRDYIWKSKPDGGGVAGEIYSAPYRRLAKNNCSHKRPFSTWTCAVNVQDSESCSVYKRILRAGGARIIDISFEDATKSVPVELTHLFTDKFCKGRYLDMIAKNSVHCLHADYMGDVLIKGGPPQPYHYVTPYCPVDLTLSPNNSDNSVVLVGDSSKNDTDSDIEIVSWSSPVRPTVQGRHNGNRLPKSPLAVASHPPSKASCSESSSSQRMKCSNNKVKKSLNNQLGLCEAGKTSKSVYNPDSLLVVKNEPNPSSADTSMSESSLAQNISDNSENIPSSEVAGSVATVAYCPIQTMHMSQRYATAFGSTSNPSPKKYSKLLLLTPPKLNNNHPQSPQSNTSLTPSKSHQFGSQTSEPDSIPHVHSPTASLSSKSRRKSKKRPAMPRGSLHKYVTPVKSMSAEDNGLISKNEKSQKFGVSDISLSNCSISVSTVEAENNHQKIRVLEGKSCLGLLDKLTSRLDLSDREKLYQKHEQITAINSVPAEEEIDLTDDFQSKALQELPVVLHKQIRTYFEDDFKNDRLNGLELLELCTSHTHYPQPQLLQHIYHLLLNTTDPVVAHKLYNYLRIRITLNPPYKRLHEELSTSSKTRRMRDIYMQSLVDKDYFQRTYLKNLCVAVQTIKDGGLTIDNQSLPPLTKPMDDDDAPLSPMEAALEETESTQEDVEENSTEERDGCLGSKLFIDYLHQLLMVDHSTVKAHKDSMLYNICKGVGFTTNFVDSKDTRHLLDSMEYLMTVRETETAHKLVELVGLLAEFCRPDHPSATNHSFTVIISKLSTIVKGCDLKEADHILMGCLLPPWLSYKIIIDILDDRSTYSNQLISSTAESLTLPSLQALISQYCFLIPIESVITNRSIKGGAKNEQQPHALPTGAKQKKNNKGETALHTACIRGDLEKVKQLLLKPETNVNAADYAGWTPLHEACNHGHLKIVELLLTHKSSHFHFDGGGQVDMLAVAGDDSFTPLHDAVNVGAVEVVKLLLKHGGRKLLMAQSRLGTVFDITDNEEMLLLLTDALKATDFQENENNSSNETLESGLHIAPPHSEIYHTHKCTTNKNVVERYVLYCCHLLSLHVAAFPLTHLDKKILNSLSTNIQQFVEHVQWLSATDAQTAPDFLINRIRGLLLLSL